MKWAIVVGLALVACKKTAPPPTSTPPPPPTVAEPEPTDAAPDGTVPAIPATALAGNLAGKPFTVKKAMLRTSPQGTRLELYAWSEGGPCMHQFAPEPDQLYASVSFPEDQLVVGKDVVGATATYKKPDHRPLDDDTTLVFDRIGSDTATGRLLLTAPDGTRIAGGFEATVCASPQQPLAAPAPIHGLAWGTRDVDPKSLPKQPVVGALLGKVGSPVAVEIVDWKDVAEQHEVHFYFTPPKQPCQFDQLTPGFKVAFGVTLKRGLSINTESPIVARGLQPWATVIWNEPGNSIGEAGKGWVSAIIDKHTRDTVEGRVFAWFEDPSKSMIVGAFTAKNCNSKP
jgi:hypothetical protein